MPNTALRAAVQTMLAALLLAGLAGCVPGGEGGKAPTPLTAPEISVTALPPAGAPAPDSAADGAAPDASPGTALEEVPAAERPEPTPSSVAEDSPDAAAEAAAPPPPPSPEALACQRRGGAYVPIRPGGPRSCIRQTGEGAKRCTRQTDCTGQCLARSGTCSPVTPLFGCNEILQADGRRATLCIE